MFIGQEGKFHWHNMVIASFVEGKSNVIALDCKLGQINNYSKTKIYLLLNEVLEGI